MVLHQELGWLALSGLITFRVPRAALTLSLFLFPWPDCAQSVQTPFSTPSSIRHPRLSMLCRAEWENIAGAVPILMIHHNYSGSLGPALSTSCCHQTVNLIYYFLFPKAAADTCELCWVPRFVYTWESAIKLCVIPASAALYRPEDHRNAVRRVNLSLFYDCGRGFSVMAATSSSVKDPYTSI